MKLYETKLDPIYGLKPITIRGRRYDASKSELIRVDGDVGYYREVYVKKNGECWMHIKIAAIGDYIALLPDVNVDAIRNLKK